MSLILDALRKSEHQRQRQVGPGLAVVAEGRAGRRPATWVLVLAGLLTLNILVLAALLLTDRRDERAPPPAAAAAPATTPAAPTVDAAPGGARPAATRSTAFALPAKPPRNEVRPLATEIAAAAPAPRAPAAGPAVGTPGAPPASAASRPSIQQASEDARLPRFADLVIRGELNVPHMHIDIHVFSENPAERFVFINMRKLTEGEATQEGPRVERITRDGVVMDHQGQQFFLSRD
jgi:general secretion pathway protein B